MTPTRFAAELEDGTTIYGSTNYPHYLPELQVEVPYYQIVRVESVSVFQPYGMRSPWVP